MARGMSGGALRKPTVLLEAQGAFKKNPNRRRDNEPTPRGKFPKSPPKLYELSIHEKKCWRHLVSIVPPGVLRDADIATVLLAAKLMSRIILNTFHPSELTRYSVEIGKLGLSPSDRARLTVDKNKANEFDD